MPYFDWNEAKNELLKAGRGIGFEDIQAAITAGTVLDDKEHSNKTRYPNQRILVVKVNGYAYLVPYVWKDERTMFLKTIIPSRKATKDYLKSKGDEL